MKEVLIYLVCDKPNEIEKIIVDKVHNNEMSDLEKFCWAKKLFHFPIYDRHLEGSLRKASISSINEMLMERNFQLWSYNYRLERYENHQLFLSEYIQHTFEKVKSRNDEGNFRAFFKSSTKSKVTEYRFEIFPKDIFRGRILLNPKNDRNENSHIKLSLMSEGWKIFAVNRWNEILEIDDPRLLISKDFFINWFRKKHGVAMILRNKKIKAAMNKWSTELWKPPNGKFFRESSEMSCKLQENNNLIKRTFDY